MVLLILLIKSCEADLCGLIASAGFIFEATSCSFMLPVAICKCLILSCHIKVYVTLSSHELLLRVASC